MATRTPSGELVLTYEEVRTFLTNDEFQEFDAGCRIIATQKSPTIEEISIINRSAELRRVATLRYLNLQ